MREIFTFNQSCPQKNLAKIYNFKTIRIRNNVILLLLYSRYVHAILYYGNRFQAVSNHFFFFFFTVIDRM